MERTDVIIIGAGQAGLAASAELRARAVEHVVLERGQIGERWRNERWNTLRLLTPNWMTRLPGRSYAGPNRNGFMHKDDLVSYLAEYAAWLRAPIREHAPVERLSRLGDSYHIESGAGSFLARAVIIATGACDQPRLPAWAQALAPHIDQITTRDYKSPDQLAQGGVLVVGAAATGVQLADEIHAAGHDVTISAGRHMALPRRYRGRDIMEWMDTAGLLDTARDRTVTTGRALHHPSAQLIGSDLPRDMSLAGLAAQDIRPISRVIGADGARLRLAGDLATNMANAQAAMTRTLDKIDAHIAASGLPAQRRTRPSAPRFVPSSRESLDLDRAGIRTVVWATGFARDYSWIDLPVLTAHGELRETGGILELPGLYALGLPFMRTRSSANLSGIARDAAAITDHLATYLGAVPRARAA